MIALEAAGRPVPAYLELAAREGRLRASRRAIFEQDPLPWLAPGQREALARGAED
jgi:hypothetical protein